MQNETTTMYFHTVPCQGHDDCRDDVALASPGCSQCHLHACAKHSIWINGGLWCQICLEKVAKAGGNLLDISVSASPLPVASTVSR
jgi:hypothetical protein